jgi:AraC-like DNA-binding protein
VLNHKLPPPSLEATARDLGYDRETLARNFRDLCRAVSTKYDEYERVRHLKSIKKCCEDVRQVVLQLHEQLSVKELFAQFKYLMSSQD